MDRVGQAKKVEVMAGCPQCDWESTRYTADDSPNGEWVAFSQAAGEYRWHFDRLHRPLFRRLRQQDGGGWRLVG